MAGTSASRHPGASRLGLGLLLDWLEAQPGLTWQDRWLVSGADADGRTWRQIPDSWLRERGHHTSWRRERSSARCSPRSPPISSGPR
jgi:hypothetical protein